MRCRRSSLFPANFQALVRHCSSQVERSPDGKMGRRRNRMWIALRSGVSLEYGSQEAKDGCIADLQQRLVARPESAKTREGVAVALSEEGPHHVCDFSETAPLVHERCRSEGIRELRRLRGR